MLFAVEECEVFAGQLNQEDVVCTIDVANENQSTDQ
jgi:hypothetical protein